MLRLFVAVTLVTAAASFGDTPSRQFGTLEIPITPFSNMASGYQATNPGFRAVLRNRSGRFIAGGPLTMDAVINGRSDDASQGSAYRKLTLVIDMMEPSLAGGLSGNFKGLLSICMAKDENASMAATVCADLQGNLHPERPFQWIDKEVEYTIQKGTVQITRYFGKTGEGGTKEQLSLATFHPAFGFAAPGKAFKDYQSPLVVDLNRNGKLDLVNVWDARRKVNFDFIGNGEKVRTGWVKANDGILFWDNGTGCVQNGTQLFGPYFGSTDGKQTFADGFAALKSKAANANEVVVADLPQLKIWKDKKQDGICHKSEVISASGLIKKISLQYQTIENPKLNEDNEVRMVSTYTAHNGKSYSLGDVWFKQRRNTLVHK